MFDFFEKTPCIRSILNEDITVSIFVVSEGLSMTIVAKVSGDRKHDTRLVAERLHPDPKIEAMERLVSKWGTPSLKRPHLIILSQQSTKWELSIQIYEHIVDILIETTTPGED